VSSRQAAGERSPEGPERSGGAPRTSLGVIFLVLFTDLVAFGMLFPIYGGLLTFYSESGHPLMGWILATVDAIHPGSSPNQRVALFGGIMAALYAGLQFIAAPLWGRLSDRVGRRPVLLFSMIGTLVANLLWVFGGDFGIFILSRVLAGGLSGNVGVANAAVADITTPENRGRGLAAIGMAFGFGFIIGPAIGGLVSAQALRVDALGWPGLHPFSTVALVAAGLGAVNLVWALARFRETIAPERRGQPGAPRPLNPLQLIDPALGSEVRALNLACLFHTLIFSGLEATLVFLTWERFAFDPMANGWLFVWMGFVSLLANGVLFRRLVTKVGPRPLAMFGLVVMAPGYLLVGLVDWHAALWLLVLGSAVLSVGTGTVFPGLNTMASLAADPARQGWVMGTFRSASALGRAIGPLLGAVVYFAWRPGATYLVCAGAVLLPLWLVWRVRPVVRS
jgi:MFS family permease